METSDEPSLLIRALRQVLYPLVRLTLTKGVTYPQFQELLKSVFVEVAEKEFRLKGKEQTDSRISLLSGLHRKDVRRLRTQPATEESVTSRSIPLGAQVVSRWSGDPLYLGEDGLPRPLPRAGESPADLSFETLVSSINKDIRPRALLDEWLSQGIVTQHENGQISLNMEAFVPQAGIEEKLFYLAHNLHDHAAAAANNICSDGTPLLERCVHYNGITSDTIKSLQKMTEAKGMKLLLDINRAAAASLEKEPEAPNPPRERFTFGIYFYREPQAPDHDEHA